ncbi:hypothetical protein WMF37_11100 [Sorangium sp. So ce291]|uniref:hypothetical protein n=1 Tax=Sorangium sp. So ce291 TaxID=3133294 RepID=UPI003F632A32
MIFHHGYEGLACWMAGHWPAITHHPSPITHHAPNGPEIARKRRRDTLASPFADGEAKVSAM